MRLRVLTVRDLGAEVRAYVRADAVTAQITLRLTFPRPAGAGKAELWRRARIETLKYLDIA